MTFSVIGRCRRTGHFGVAVSTSSICVGARCVWVREGVGVVGTQSRTNPALGKLGLDMLQDSMPASRVLERLIEADGPNVRYRQLSVLGAAGPPAAYTGSEASAHRGEAFGPDCAAAGNLLARPEVVDAMVDAFEAAPDEHLAERLLRGIEAGLAAGGEHADVRSAALQVKADQVWPICDLRVDWDDADPISRLRAHWTDYEPLMEEFAIRAIDPGAVPDIRMPGAG